MKKLITPNQISMEVDGRETSASICYTIRTIDDVTCGKKYSDEKTCLNIPLTPIGCGPNDGEVTGTIQTEGGDITYTITQKHYDCEEKPQCQCSCDIINKWTIPHYIGKDYPNSGEVKVYYEYWHTSADTKGNVCSRERKIGVNTYRKETLPRNPIAITAETGCNDNCITNVYTAETINGCESTPSTSVTVNFSTDPAEVQGSEGNVWYIPSLANGEIYDTFEDAQTAAAEAGLTDNDIVRAAAKVTITCNFKEVIVDAKCNETIINGSFTSATTIPICDNSDVSCCYDHNVDITIPVAAIRTKLNLPTSTKVIYNGSEVTDNVVFSIKQTRRYDGQCAGICDYVTTYCVDSGTVKVYYESQYGKRDWEEGGCLPIYGGRVKVTWRYTAHTESIQGMESCPSKDIEGVWEDIMLIGDCRDLDHPDQYQIFFKEQTPGCTTCEGGLEREDSTIISNTFIIKAVKPGDSETGICQDCNSYCSCDSILRFKLNDSSDCNCDNFSFSDSPTPPTDCNCDNFSFTDSPTPPTDCNCNNFSFSDSPTPPTDCNCNNFNFDDSPTPDCDCNKFNFKDEE